MKHSGSSGDSFLWLEFSEDDGLVIDGDVEIISRVSINSSDVTSGKSNRDLTNQKNVIDIKANSLHCLHKVCARDSRMDKP